MKITHMPYGNINKNGIMQHKGINDKDKNTSPTNHIEGLSTDITITTDMVNKAISKMKLGKAPGPSDTAVEMINEAADTGATGLD